MGLWSGIKGLFGSKPAKSPEQLFTELGVSLLEQHPQVSRVELLGGEGLSVKAWLHDGMQHTLFLRNTFLETREASEEERIRRLLGVMNFDPVPADWAEAESSFVPLLRISHFAGFSGAGEHMASRPFAPGLSLLLGLDREQSMAYAMQHQLEKWGHSLDEGLAIAFANLQRHVDAQTDAQLLDESLPYPIWHVTRDDSYETSRLALPGYLAKFRGKVRGNPIAIVPHRALMMIGGDADAECIERLARTAESEFASATRSTSPAMYGLNERDEVVPLHLPTTHPLHELVERGHRLLKADCYANQQQELRKRFEADGTDIFVATYKLMGKKDEDAVRGLGTVTRDVLTLLPFADDIVIVPMDDTEPFLVPWDKVLELAPECFEPAPDYDPPRLRVVSFPTEDVLRRLRQLSV